MRYSAVVFRSIFYSSYTYTTYVYIALLFFPIYNSQPYDLHVQNRNFCSTFLNWYKSIAFLSHHFWNTVTVLPYILFNSESPIHLYSQRYGKNSISKFIQRYSFDFSLPNSVRKSTHKHQHTNQTAITIYISRDPSVVTCKCTIEIVSGAIFAPFQSIVSAVTSSCYRGN